MMVRCGQLRISVQSGYSAVHMTDLQEPETREQPVDLATVRGVEASPQSRILSSSSRSVERYFALLGYAGVCLVLLASLLEFVSWAIWSVEMGTVHPSEERAAEASQKASPVYEGVDWAKDFWREEALRKQVPNVYVPFRLWSVTSWHGRYINNDAGPTGVWRRTLNPAHCDPGHALSAWTFGGSTMYGYGAPDWATIPSYLSRELNAVSGNCVVVSNFGVEGYVSDQELILLEEQLKAGGRPDIVVLYDGVNDSTLAWNPWGPPPAHFSAGTIQSRVEGSVSGRLDFLQKSYARRLAGAMLAHLRSRPSFAPLISRSQPNVRRVVDNYEANLRIAQALSRAYQFKLYCFWQPILIYGHKPFVPFEQHVVAASTDGMSVDSASFLVMRGVYQEAERRAEVNGDFVFLGNLFDATRDPIYMDVAHLGPEGNQLAAKAIASRIRNRPQPASGANEPPARRVRR